MVSITKKDLERWRDDSLSVASELGYDKNTLKEILVKSKLSILAGFPQSGIFFGYCNFAKYEIQVYENNLSTSFDFNFIKSLLKEKGMPQKVIDIVMKSLESITPREFFEVFNQSGMDHELIGHLYNEMAKQDSGEETSVYVQIEFAKARSGRAWEVIRNIMPVVLGYHKNIDELK
jgi:hypothetical protein